jgi:hypothetical protein
LPQGLDSLVPRQGRLVRKAWSVTVRSRHGRGCARLGPQLAFVALVAQATALANLGIGMSPSPTRYWEYLREHL